MYVDGVWVRLDPSFDSVSLRPEHWSVNNARAGLVRHLPTGNCYKVEIGDEVQEGEKASIFNLRAQLYWMPEGGVIPHGDTQVKFGCAAIAVFMVHRKLWKPHIVDVPERPEDSPRKRLARGLHR
jgi:hypothetical protein